MSLNERVILEIDLRREDRTGVFEFREVEDTREIDREFIMSQRGQYVNEIWDFYFEHGALEQLPQPEGAHRRAGYNIDAGAGSDTVAISFTTGPDPGYRWGDGSSDPDDPADYSKFDAQGSHPLVKRQVFAHYLREARTDSGGQARLHIGEWTDGEYSDGEGVFGEPINIVIPEASMERSENDPATIEGRLEVVRTSVVPDFAQELDDVVEDVVDVVESIIPDW